MERIIKSMEGKYLLPSLELVEEVFSRYQDPEEGRRSAGLWARTPATTAPAASSPATGTASWQARG